MSVNTNPDKHVEAFEIVAVRVCDLVSMEDLDRHEFPRSSVVRGGAWCEVGDFDRHVKVDKEAAFAV